MTDDRLNNLRDIAVESSRKRKKVTIDGFDLAALIDMIDRLRAEAEEKHEYTVGDLV